MLSARPRKLAPCFKLFADEAQQRIERRQGIHLDLVLDFPMTLLSKH